LRVPWTARRSNQALLKEISPEYSLEGLMLTLKFKYFGHLTQRTVSLEKTLMLGKNEGRRIRGWQRMRWLDGIETCIISCMKRVASPGSMHDTGCLGLVHWDDPEGGYGERGGFRMRNICMPVADSFRYMAEPIQYCKV